LILVVRDNGAPVEVRDGNSFGLFRILGNSLPPRHAASQTLELTEFILRNEPAFEDCTKFWILNRLVDQAQQDALLALIRDRGQEAIVIPFDAQAHNDAFLDPSGIPESFQVSQGQGSEASSSARVYKLEWLIRHKSQALVNINQARNLALQRGRGRFRWSLPLDGGVMFSEGGWREFVQHAAVESEALFAVIPMTRVHNLASALEAPARSGSAEEPQLAFRSDSRATFDERLRYGNQNKVELLRRLGVRGIWDEWSSTPWETRDNDPGSESGRYFTAGHVLRLPTGAAASTEKASSSRWISRFQGVSDLSRSVDARFAASFRREHSGWFMMQAPSGLDAGMKEILRTAGAAAFVERDISILDKAKVAPSGNRQDYHSMAPHHHGVHRIDGVRRPEARMGSPGSLDCDRTGMDRFCRRSSVLAIAGSILRERHMLEASARLIRMWLIDPSTRMNPNLSHAQRVEGEFLGRHIGIIDIRDLWFMPQTVDVLRAEGVLDAAEVDHTRQWCRALLGSLSASPQFAALSRAHNNIATWSMAVVAALLLHCGETEMAAVRLRNAPHLIADQFGPLNMQTKEVARTRPLHYSLFNLSGFAAITVLGWHVGMDIRNYRGVDGQNLGGALNFAARNRDIFQDYAGNPKQFDAWIEALGAIFADGRAGGDAATFMLDGDLGLPPLWPLLAPSFTATRNRFHTSAA
jgi:hypothetical protein